MPVQLTKEQIDKLAAFTQLKRVNFYDVQLELVDHLASKMEELMEQDSTLSFEKALDKVYSSFGIYGFAKVVEEKQRSIEKLANRMWWQEIKTFFTWPRLTIAAVVMLLSYMAYQYFNSVFVINLFQTVYFGSYIGWWWEQTRKKPIKRLALLSTNVYDYNVPLFIYSYFVFIGPSDFLGPALFCVVATFGVLSQVAVWQIYKKLRQRAIAQYPAAFRPTL